jgi:UDP-glucose 4-epimerase
LKTQKSTWQPFGLQGHGAALKGCDAVIHIALGWGNTPVEMLENDTRATAHLADAAEKNGVAK